MYVCIGRRHRAYNDNKNKKGRANMAVCCRQRITILSSENKPIPFSKLNLTRYDIRLDEALHMAVGDQSSQSGLTEYTYTRKSSLHYTRTDCYQYSMYIILVLHIHFVIIYE